MFYVPDSEIEKFMPHPEKSLDSDKLGCEIRLSEELLYKPNAEIYIQHAWKSIYENAVREVTNIIMGRREHFVCRYIPTVLKEFYGIRFRVVYEIMVCQTKEFIIPTFKYSEGNEIIEWRCGYCSSPNEKKARHCSQCGAPRALLIQELDD